jgi:Insertion element 4 transposase N-terminal/Transposase DDE domain
MQESATVVRSAGRVAAASAEKGLPLRLGVLTEQIGPGLVDDVVTAAGATQRRRRLLPARAVVYFVLGLCLLSGADGAGPPGYRSVVRSLTTGLRGRAGVRLPSTAALTRARQRLGVEPLRLLFERLRGPLAGPGTPGPFVFGRRLVAWDSTGLDVPDTAANAAAFGRHGGRDGTGGAGHPQLRLLTVLECGTHALLAAVFDGWGRVDELSLARRAIDRLGPGMLLLADRNFPGYHLWGQAAASGADLLWRIRKNLIFTPVRRLPDGSFLTVMGTPAENARFSRARAAGRPLPGPPAGHLVRIVEYTVTVSTDAGSRTEAFRLASTLLDPIAAPARQLAEVYHQRWEIELGYSELKTRLRGPGVLLRSRCPDLVCQEMFAFLVVYQALTGLRVHAARAGDLDPDRISFTIAVRRARDHAGDPATGTQALAQVIDDLLEDRLPARRARCYQRIKRPAKNTYPSRRPDQPRPPGHATFTLTITHDEPYQGKRPK